MNNNVLKSNFKEWVETVSGKPFPTDAFLSTCLNEAVNSVLHSKYNGRPFIEHYPPVELFRELFREWKSTALLFVKQPVYPGVNLCFGKTPVSNDPDHRKELCELLDQLSSVCLA